MYLDMVIVLLYALYRSNIINQFIDQLVEPAICTVYPSFGFLIDTAAFCSTLFIFGKFRYCPFSKIACFCFAL